MNRSPAAEGRNREVGGVQRRVILALLNFVPKYIEHRGGITDAGAT